MKIWPVTGCAWPELVIAGLSTAGSPAATTSVPPKSGFGAVAVFAAPDVASSASTTRSTAAATILKGEKRDTRTIYDGSTRLRKCILHLPAKPSNRLNW